MMSTVVRGKREKKEKKSKNKKKRAATQPKLASQSGQKMVSRLGVEATIYIRALANPFSGKLPTIPSLPALLTQRCRVYAKGIFSTGGAVSTGIGFICMNPLGSLANNDPNGFVYFSNGVASTALGFPGAVAAAGTTLVNSNAQYPVASFSPQGLRGRVVAAGLRIRYEGRLIDLGGYVTGITEPNHASLQNGTIPNIEAWEESARFRPTEKGWISLAYKPVQDTDDDFIGNPGVVGAAFATPGTFYMGFLVQSPDPSGALLTVYEFEAYCCVEYIGSIVRNKTPSTVDLSGYSAAHTAAAFSPVISKPSTMPVESKANAIHQVAAKHHAAISPTALLDTATKVISNLPISTGDIMSAAETGWDVLSSLFL